MIEYKRGPQTNVYFSTACYIENQNPKSQFIDRNEHFTVILKKNYSNPRYLLSQDSQNICFVTYRPIKHPLKANHSEANIKIRTPLLTLATGRSITGEVVSLLSSCYQTGIPE